jgi:hypothetical protein
MGFNLRKPDPEPSVRACELLDGPQDGLILEVEDRRQTLERTHVTGSVYLYCRCGPDSHEFACAGKLSGEVD